MKVIYQALAYLICLGVALQAAAIGLGFFGLARWVTSGNVIDTEALEHDTAHMTGHFGLAFHDIAGEWLIPLAGLLLLICSLFVRVRGAIAWAGIVLGAIVIQLLLGMLSFASSFVGAVHGTFAFAVLVLAAVAGYRITRRSRRSAPDSATNTTRSLTP
jgi:hypothetical protein